MNTQIPELAMKVVEVLRRDVPKPKELPIAYNANGNNNLRWKDVGYYYCPMNLHPFLLKNDDLPNKEIVAFAKWWDSQTDAQAAVDAVWGKN